MTYPMLSDSNYGVWAVKIKILMRALGVWVAVEGNAPVDEEKDQGALIAISQAVSDAVMMTISEKESTKEAWESMKEMRIREDRVKKANVIVLRRRRKTTRRRCLLRTRTTNRRYSEVQRRAVPGLPVIGNLLQLKEKKPHQTFANWADEYGPIYSIKLGANTMVVLNSAEVAKEAMVTKYSSISTRKLSKALMLLTSNKSLVAMSDYGDYHKMVKRYILQSLLGPNAQRRNRAFRDTMIQNILDILHAEISYNPTNALNFREPFKSELFQLALKQAIGQTIESIYVEELGVEMSKKEIFEVLVIDPMMGAIEVDWRDFFPYLRWVPNKSLEKKINRMATRKRAVTKALIAQQRKRIALGEELNCYVDYLLAEEHTLTEEQLITLVWEAIIETSDTTLVTTEWAMYELAKNPKCQDRLYREIQEVCGPEKLTEEHLPKLPYLSGVFHETLRFHSPVPVIPPRFAHEDTQLGGYDIPAGTEIAINLFACNMDKNIWDEPNEWEPARFLSSKYDQMDLYKTMAFGGGRRVCAGSTQAMLISSTAIGRFVQEFQWKLKEGQEEDVDTILLTTTKLHPMYAYIMPRGAHVLSQEHT